MRRYLKNYHGYSLLEVMVGVAILGGVSFAVMNLSDYIGKNVYEAEEAAKEPRLINSIISEALKNINSFPGKVVTANNSLLDAALFDDPQVADYLCFTGNGVQVPLDSFLCRFKLDFYRTELRDSSFRVDGNLGALPVERVFFKLTDLKEKDKAPKFYSKLITKMITN